MMKRGDIVRHKLENEVYRILKVGENVAICQCAPYSHKSMGWWMSEAWESYICNLENLEPYPQGKIIFDWVDSFDDKFFEESKTNFKNRWKEITHEPGEQLKLL
jgi:hypothetical protein